MKVGKFIKKMVFASLAVLMVATMMPYYSSVKAAGTGSSGYADEVSFPIEVLDFPQDNLLFQWKAYDGSDRDLELYQNYYGLGNGKGLVEDELGPDGLPVYKKETVEIIAQAVQRRLHWGYGGSIFDQPHYLNMRLYVGTAESVLDVNTNQDVSDNTKWEPDVSSLPAGHTPSLRLEKKNGGTITYDLTGIGIYTYNNVYAEVYDDALSSEIPIYILKKDAIIFFYNVTVSRTFTLPANSSYRFTTFGQQSAGDTNVYITDSSGTRSALSGDTVTTGDDGKITVTIKAGNGQWDTPLSDAMSLYGQKYGVWNIGLRRSSMSPAYLGTNPGGGSVIYPLGDYDESKEKFDGNPDLGWTDIRTCMDYAYFVTSHFFKYHPSLNVKYSDYENLIFHKVEEPDTKKVFYEFAAARHDLSAVPSPALPLIYNKTDKTIRNLYTGTTVNPAAGDAQVAGGSFFIVDDADELRLRYFGFDNKLQDMWGQLHNFLYTVKSSSKFVYKEGAHQYFYFAGDDDVYVYVNGHLYIDLGGAHIPLEGEIDLDEVAAAHPDWGIQSNKVVSLDLFYMERHTDQANFYAKMNFKLAEDEVKFNLPYDVIPYGYLVDLEYSLTTRRELVTNKNITFKDNFNNVIGAEDFKLADGIGLKRKTTTDSDGNVVTDFSTGVLTVTVKKADGTEDGREFEFPNLYEYDSESGKWKRSREFTSAEIAAVKNYFANLELIQDEVVTINGPQYDTSYKAYDEYADIGGEGIAEKGLEFVTEVSYDVLQEGSSQVTQGNVTETTPVKVLIGGFKVCTAQEDNEKKELADYGKFTIDRELFGESEYARKDPMPYTNNPAILTVTEHMFDQVPRGKYTIKLDDSVLSSYKVTVNDEEVTELTIDFEPEYDPVEETWIYPDVKFELKAKRNAPDLKDLT